MPNVAANVTVGKPKVTGGIFVAPTGTALPTNASTALNAAYVSLGYVGDAGLVNAIDTQTADIIAWGGDTVLTVKTSRSETFQYTLVEALNESVLAEVFGSANVTSTAGVIAVKHNGVELPNKQYVFEMLMTGGKIKRISVPLGKVTAVDNVTYVDGEPVAYAVTLTTFPDASGNTAYEWISAA